MDHIEATRVASDLIRQVYRQRRDQLVTSPHVFDPDPLALLDQLPYGDRDAVVRAAFVHAGNLAGEAALWKESCVECIIVGSQEPHDHAPERYRPAVMSG